MDRINDPSAVNQRFIDEDLLAGVQGTIVRALWANGMQEELIAGLIEFAGLTPNAGDNTLVRQAILLLCSGRLLNRRVLPGGAYTPTSGTRVVIFEAIGGGGGGGGAVSPQTNQVSAGSGGGGGGYAIKRVTAGFAGVMITNGAGGAGNFGAAGSSGLTTSVGSLLSATGGGGGTLGPSQAASGVPFGGAGGGVGVGGDENAAGGAGLYAIYTQPATSGVGGSSNRGAGGGFVTGSTNGLPAVSMGAGGGGGVQSIAAGGSAAGGKGADGGVIAWEFNG